MLLFSNCQIRYTPSKWSLWARSSKSEIPVLRSTMIVESHWRLIKHDFLYKFNKPRTDLLVWVLVDRLLPRYLIKYRKIANPLQSHRAVSSWRSEFKRNWKDCAKKPYNNNNYNINPLTWTCSCPAFLENRFFICKHLIHSVRPVTPQFFLEAKRQRSPPFWLHADLYPL